MIVAIQQPEHLPWMGFFDKMLKCDAYVFLDNVQFKKRYFENRNKIRVSDGWQWITVPVISKGRYTQKIQDVEIDNSGNWQRKYLESITRAYSKTEYYSIFFSGIEKIIKKNYTSLRELNIALINFFRKHLGIQTPCYKASELLSDKYSGSDLILNICRSIGATTYFSGPDGGNYLSDKDFSAAGIKIIYHSYQHPVYQQIDYETFIPYMSICDYMFNHGEDL